MPPRDSVRAWDVGPKPKFHTPVTREAKEAVKRPRAHVAKHSERDDSGDNFFGRALKATGRAASSVIDTVGDVDLPIALAPGANMRPGNQFGGNMRSQKVKPAKVKHAVEAVGETSGALPAWRIRAGKGSAMDWVSVGATAVGPFGRAASAAMKASPKLGIVALAGHNPKKLLKVEGKYEGHSRARDLDTLRTAEKDLSEYADYANEEYWARKPHAQGEYAGEALDAPVVHAIYSMTGQNRQVIQNRAGKWADQLEEGLNRSRPDVDPAHMGKKEFAASPFATWHTTRSAPGLSSIATKEGIHTGTATSALERMISLAAFRTSAKNEMAKFRLLPVALRGRALDDVVSDNKANDWLSYGNSSIDGKPYDQGLTPQQINKLRKSGRSQFYHGTEAGNARSLIDIVPYENDVEGIGDVSFLATNPLAVRTHLDLIRDYMAKFGTVPEGLADYPNSHLLEQRLLKEIEAAQAALKDPFGARIAPQKRRSVNNAFRAALANK